MTKGTVHEAKALSGILGLSPVCFNFRESRVFVWPICYWSHSTCSISLTVVTWKSTSSPSASVTFPYTYLLAPWCRVLLEKLTGLQLVKKFPAFYGPRKFITGLTSVRHLSLSWASPIQSTYPHPTSWRSILILSTHLQLGLPSITFPYTKLNSLDFLSLFV